MGDVEVPVECVSAPDGTGGRQSIEARAASARCPHTPPRPRQPRAKPRTDEVCQPQRPHGLVGAQPHALVYILRGAHALAPR